MNKSSSNRGRKKIGNVRKSYKCILKLFCNSFFQKLIYHFLILLDISKYIIENKSNDNFGKEIVKLLLETDM